RPPPVLAFLHSGGGRSDGAGTAARLAPSFRRAPLRGGRRTRVRQPLRGRVRGVALLPARRRRDRGPLRGGRPPGRRVQPHPALPRRGLRQSAGRQGAAHLPADPRLQSRLLLAGPHRPGQGGGAEGGVRAGVPAAARADRRRGRAPRRLAVRTRRRRPAPSDREMKRLPLQVAGVIVFVTAIRAILSLELELTSVESYLWVCAQRPALGYFDYPGMIAWMGWLSTALFGHSPLGVRALMIAGGAAMIWFVFLAARRLYDERVGRLAAFAAALVPIFFAFAAEATPDAPCLLFWSATVWALAHALSGDSPRWWLAAGLFLGLAMESKYHAVFLGLGVFGFL